MVAMVQNVRKSVVAVKMEHYISSFFQAVPLVQKCSYGAEYVVVKIKHYISSFF